MKATQFRPEIKTGYNESIGPEIMKPLEPNKNIISSRMDINHGKSAGHANESTEQSLTQFNRFKRTI